MTVRETAYVASTITAYETVKNFIPTIDYLSNNDLFYKPFRSAVKSILTNQINNNNNNNNNDNNNNNENNQNLKLTIENIMELKGTKNYTIQSKLTDIVSNTKYKNFIKAVKDTRYLSLLTSLNDNSCGKWLETIPKDDDFKLNNSQFTVCLNYRLFMNQPNYVSNTYCNCNKKPPLDKTGLHL